MPSPMSIRRAIDRLRRIPADCISPAIDPDPPGRLFLDRADFRITASVTSSDPLKNTAQFLIRPSSVSVGNS